MSIKHQDSDVAAPLVAPRGLRGSRLEKCEEPLDQLKHERERLAATLSSLMDPHVIFEAVRDRKGRVVDFIFTDANDAAIAYNQSTREEMIGARLTEVLPGHKNSVPFANYVRTVETGEPLILDDSVYYNEVWKSERHCDVRAVKVGDGLSYTWRDVTDRAQTMENYRLLAENASDIVYEVGRDGLLKWISPSCQILKWRPEDLIGRPCFDLIFEGDHEAAAEYRLRVLDGESPASIEARYRSSTGELHWMSASSKTLYDRDGLVDAVVVGLRNIEDEVTTRQSLAKSEAHFRLLAENSSDIVYETDTEGVIKWVSPSIYQVLGWVPEEIVGTRAVDLVAFEDAAELSERHEALLAGQKIGRAQFRLRTASGELRWMGVRAQPARGATSTIVGSVVALRDCQSEVAAQRAASTLSAGSQVLVRSEREEDLLVQMCQAAVDEGGYALAWYGRRVQDPAHSIAKVAASKMHRDYVDAIKVDWSDGPLGRGPVGTSIRTEEPVVVSGLAGNNEFAPWLGQATMHGFQSCIALPVRVEGSIDGSLQVYSADPNAFDGHVVEVLQHLAEELGFGIERLREHKRLVQSLNDQALLTKAIDQASESILITNPTGTILYANPSAVRTSGFELEELIGENPRVLQSELHDPTFFQVMWAQLLAGEPWHGTMINRRKGGELFEEDATISPVHDGEGRLMAYVAVKRDLTVERRRETNRTREQRDRLDILDIMQDVRRGASLHETAEAFCRAAANLVDIDAALMVLVQGDGTLLTIGTGGDELGGATTGVTMEFRNPRLLIERTEAGSWWVDLSQYPVVSPEAMTARMARDGFSAIGNVPIRWEGQLVGILALATKSVEGPDSMAVRLPGFEELGSYAGALFGAEANVFSKTESLRSKILEIMESRSFYPVFQPFVELETGNVVGYEALTRFSDGEPPDQRFMQAHSVGLGSELEALCAVTAVRAAKELAPETWLSLNFSPAALLDGRAAAVVDGVDRPLVIEVTEHAQIKNYTAIRRALSEIGTCKLAVDDAGAGFTSLSHILELQPDFVKLDISLVRDIDTNPARQAMIAGMCHFAAQSGTTLIAEGIETEAEASMLRQLGVPLGEAGMLGQGYLFGKPSMFT